MLSSSWTAAMLRSRPRRRTFAVNVAIVLVISLASAFLPANAAANLEPVEALGSALTATDQCRHGRAGRRQDERRASSRRKRRRTWTAGGEDARGRGDESMKALFGGRCGAGWAAVWAGRRVDGLGGRRIGRRPGGGGGHGGRICGPWTRRATWGRGFLSAVMTIISQTRRRGPKRWWCGSFSGTRRRKIITAYSGAQAARGQGYLIDGDSLWFYDPRPEQFSHTSLKEHFAGQQRAHR